MVQSDRQQAESNEAAGLRAGTGGPQAASGSSPSRYARRPSKMELPWRWLGIAVIVVLILAAVVYLARQRLPAQLPRMEPTLTPTVVEPTSTPEPTPPTATSTPKPTAISEPTPEELEIELGVEVEVVGTGIDGLSFRYGPGQNYARLKWVHDGDTFTVLEGPEEADGYRWWRLQDEAGAIGWAADNWLQPVGQ